MAKYREDNIFTKLRTLLIVICVALVFFFGTSAVLNFLLSKQEMLSADEIAENIEDFDPDKKNYDSVASCLEKLGIRGFDKQKFMLCEDVLDRESLFKTQSDGELAITTAEFFLKYYYNEIDLDDQDALTDALINCYVASIGDNYAVYRNKAQLENYKQNMSGSFAGIGVTVSYNRETNVITVISVLPGSGAEEAGIQEGDLIVGAAGQTLNEVNYDALLSLVRGEEGTTVDIALIRNGEPLTLTVLRKKIIEETVKHKMLDGDIGYIVITSFKDNTDELFKEAIDELTKSGAKGLIFDLRDNPGGYVSAVVNTLDYLVEDGVRIASYNTLNGERLYTSGDGHSVDLPMAVIFNRDTASAGELFSAAIRDYNQMGLLTAFSVGETTYKKGILQSTRYLSDGSAVTFTTSYYNPPSDVNYDGIGVEPDIPVSEESGIDAPFSTAYAEMIKFISANSN